MQIEFQGKLIGVRRIAPGEMLTEADLYLSTAGNWQRTPISGIPCPRNEVVYVREAEDRVRLTKDVADETGDDSTLFIPAGTIVRVLERGCPTEVETLDREHAFPLSYEEYEEIEDAAHFERAPDRVPDKAADR